MNKSDYEPFPPGEVAFGSRLLRGVLINQKGNKIVSILAVDLDPSEVQRVLIMDFSTQTKFTPKPIWITNEELFNKYMITFDGINKEFIGKPKRQ